jgi:hypothetical protein
VDWFATRRGVPLTRVELGARVGARLAAGQPVGLMLHHAVTTPGDLAALAQLLALLARHPMVRPTTILELNPGR